MDNKSLHNSGGPGDHTSVNSDKVDSLTQQNQELQSENQKLKYCDKITALPNYLQFQEDCKNQEFRSATILSLDSIDELYELYDMSFGEKILRLVARKLLRYSQEYSELGIGIYKIDESNFLITYKGDVSEEFIRGQFDSINKMTYVFKTGNKIEDSILLQFSLGISLNQQKSNLLQECRFALQYGKKEKKSCILFNEEMNTKKQTLKKHQHIKLVQRSFDEERFEIALQEIISNTNPNEKTYEALARLKTIDGTRYVSPIDFIAIINLLGRNLEFTDIIVKKVCLVMQEIDGTFNINLTEDDLNTPGRAQGLFELVSSFGVPARRITFEVLESIELRTECMYKTVRELKAYGFRIAIDDFGKGYSNLPQIGELHNIADIAKLDRSLMRDIDKNKINRIIVRNIIKIFRSMKMEIVAEGIERIEEQEMILKLGINKTQGYLFSEPISSQDLIEKVKNSILTYSK